MGACIPVEEVIETEAPEAIAEPEDSSSPKEDAADSEDNADATKEG